jgi:hypothetical protein
MRSSFIGSVMSEPENRSRVRDVSALLAAWSNHDPTARDALVPIIYGELR